MMYKAVKQFAVANGLTCDSKAGYAYGNFHGVYVAIEQDPTLKAKHTITFCIKEGEYPLSKPILTFLNECVSQFKYLRNVSYQNCRATAEFHGMGFGWMKHYAPMMEEFLQAVAHYVQANQLVNCCGQCGSTEGVEAYLANGHFYALCPACHSRVSTEVSSQLDSGKKGNIVTGIVGALLGSLVGVLAWVLIYQLGYIAGIVGLVMVICTFKGFTLFGGRLNLAGIVLCVLISVGMLYMAEQISLALEIKKAMGTYVGEISFFDAYRSIPQFMQFPDVKNGVIYDLIMGYILMAAGSFSIIWQTYKKHNVTPGLRPLGSIGSQTSVQK